MCGSRAAACLPRFFASDFDFSLPSSPVDPETWCHSLSIFHSPSPKQTSTPLRHVSSAAQQLTAALRIGFLEGTSTSHAASMMRHVHELARPGLASGMWVASTAQARFATVAASEASARIREPLAADEAAFMAATAHVGVVHSAGVRSAARATAASASVAREIAAVATCTGEIPAAASATASSSSSPAVVPLADGAAAAASCFSAALRASAEADVTPELAEIPKPGIGAAAPPPSARCRNASRGSFAVRDSSADAL